MESVSPTVSTTSGKRGATEQPRGNSKLIIVISAVGCLALVTVVAVLCCAFLLRSDYKPGKPGQPSNSDPPPPLQPDPPPPPQPDPPPPPQPDPPPPPNPDNLNRGSGGGPQGRRNMEDWVPQGAGGGTWPPQLENNGLPSDTEDGLGERPGPSAGLAHHHRGSIHMELSTRPPTEYSERYFLPRFQRLVLAHGPSSQPGGFTPLYDANPHGVFCTVVAGTHTLGITGAGVNGVMAKLLVQQSQGEITLQTLRSETEELHGRAVQQARRIPGTVYEVSAKKSKIYERLFSFCQEDIHPLSGVEGTVGVAILGLLRPKYYVHGNPYNKYVLYIVSPKGNATDQDFFKAYAATWRNLLLLVLKINKAQRDKKIDKIRQIRMTLLSGGIYLGRRRPEDLARVAVAELLPLVNTTDDEVLLDFAYDNNNSFFTALREIGS